MVGDIMDCNSGYQCDNDKRVTEWAKWKYNDLEHRDQLLLRLYIKCNHANYLRLFFTIIAENSQRI